MNSDRAVTAAKLIFESIETATRLRRNRVERAAASIAAEGVFGVLAALWVEVIVFLVFSLWMAGWLAGIVMLALNGVGAGIAIAYKRYAKRKFREDMLKVRELRQSAREAVRGVGAPAAAAGAFIGGALMASAIPKKTSKRSKPRGPKVAA
jgi:hypothetical protein